MRVWAREKRSIATSLRQLEDRSPGARQYQKKLAGAERALQRAERLLQRHKSTPWPKLPENTRAELTAAMQELERQQAGLEKLHAVIASDLRASPTSINIEPRTSSMVKQLPTAEPVKTSPSRRLDRAGLNDTIKEVESMQETVRNKRQMASTAFQNFDQKANQLYNLLSSVMKAMNEMRMGTVRNML